MTDAKPHIVRDLDTGEVFEFDRIELFTWLSGDDAATRENLVWENRETGNTIRMNRRTGLGSNAEWGGGQHETL